MKTTITLAIDTADLRSLEDSYLAALWHAAQANPAPIENRDAGRLVEEIGREIITRWLAGTPALLWAHQGSHADWFRRLQEGHEPQTATMEGNHVS